MEITGDPPFHSTAMSANSKPQGPHPRSSRNETADLEPQKAPEKKTPEQMGEFKNKKGLEETTDLKIGPDIRFALRSRNPAFLQRILWGPLTVAEYREVKYRLREIQDKGIEGVHLLPGNIASEEDKKSDRDTHEGTEDGIVDISV